jgi:hypothetical protein
LQIFFHAFITSLLMPDLFPNLHQIRWRCWARLLCLSLWLTASLATHAQVPTWQQAFSGNNFQPTSGGSTSAAYATATDAAGNVYVAGSFSGQITFGNTLLGGVDVGAMFLAKWSNTTNSWVWAVSSSDRSRATARALVVRGNSIYICGSYEGDYLGDKSATIADTKVFNPIPGYADAFVAKFTDNGSSVTGNWAANGLGGRVGASSLAVYGSGVYVNVEGANRIAKFTDNGSGAALSWVVENGGPFDQAFGAAIAANANGIYVTGHIPYFDKNLFIAKYDESGTRIWLRRETGASGSYGTGIAVKDNSIYITGWFGGGDIAGAHIPGNSGAMLLLAKYTDTGTDVTGVWARGDGSVPNDGVHRTDAYGHTIAVDGSSVYVGGTFSGSNATAAPIAGASLSPLVGGTPTLFVAKYTDAGASVAGAWANCVQAPTQTYVYGLAAGNGLVYAACYINPEATAQFGPDLLTPSASAVLGQLNAADGSWQRADFPLKGGVSRVRATATDAAGNIYVTGNYTGTVGFGNTVLSNAVYDTYAAVNDIFVAKWSATTNSWAWAVRAGGTGNDYGTGIAVSGSNVYVTGYFDGIATVSGSSLTSAGGQDMFVAKYTDHGSSASNGWAVRGGGTGDDTGAGVATRGSSVFVTGRFASGASASVAGQALVGAGGADMFIAKFTDNGGTATGNWARAGGGTADDAGAGIAVSGGSVLVTGYFTSGSAATIAGITLPGAGDTDAFVAKYTDTGTGTWAQSGGGTAADAGSAVAVSGSSVYVTGSFGAAASIAGASLTHTGNQDVFVAKYIDNGTTAANGWAVRGGGSGEDRATALAVGGSSLYITGYFQSTSNMTIAGTTLPGTSRYSWEAGNLDVFVAKYIDAGSNAVDGWALGNGGGNHDYSYGIAVSGDRITIAGSVFPDPAITFGASTLSNPINNFYVNFLAQVLDVVPPTLTSFDPANGPVGASVVLTGTGFTGATAVAFHGTAASAFTVDSDTQITVSVPSGASTGVVSVTTPGGTATGSTSFVVTVPDLVISTSQSLNGSYHNVTVAAGGVATLTGPLTIGGTLTVENSGQLLTNCQPLIGTGSFVLAPGGTLGICDAAGIADAGATGAVQLSGTRSFAPDASYIYNSTLAQTTGTGLPATVRSLTSTNAAALTLTQPLAVVQVLTVAGTGDVALNGQALTLLSDASGTALVVNSGTGRITGSTATMQRYIDRTLNPDAGYRQYSAPVSGSTVADLATTNFEPAVNAAYNGSSPNSATPFPNVFGYNQARLADASLSALPLSSGKGWESPASLGSPLEVGRGYTVQIDADEKVDFTGTLNTGPCTLSLARNTTGTAAENAASGLHLLGNPYPAPLDWSSPGITRSGVDAALFVFESTGPFSGAYRSYANGFGGSPLVASGQGFFVRVTPGQSSGTVAFSNEARLTSYGEQVGFRRGEADTRPQLHLSLGAVGAPARLRDVAYVYEQAGATAGVDAEFDAAKLSNPSGLGLNSVAATEALSINGLPVLSHPTRVALKVQVPAKGTYTLQADKVLNLPLGDHLYLVDSQTGQQIDLSLPSPAAMTVTAANAGTWASRYYLNWVPAASVLATTPGLSTASVRVYPNPTARGKSLTVLVPSVTGASQVEARLLNSLGQVVQEVPAAALPAGGARLQVATQGLASGVYMLRLTAGLARLSVRVVIE